MAIVPIQSPPVVLRNRQLATNIFGVNNMGQPMTAVPRYKFMFFARFVANADAISLFPWMTSLDDVSIGVSFKIRSIDKPKIDLQATELNQYNRKRWVYTKTEYSPLNIRMFDTVDNRPLYMWKDYFLYYFGDSRANKESVMNEMPVNATFGDSTGWGLRPLSETLSFFSRIELYSISNKRYTQVNYLNPKITAIDWQQHETSSSDLEEVSMSLRYEALEYFDEQPITDSLMASFGFTGLTTPVIDPAGIVDGATNTYSSRPSTSSTAATYSNLVNQQTATSINSPSNSVVANFGLNSALYQSFTQSGPSAATTSSLQLISQPGKQYSNISPSNQGVGGIPNNTLPTQTGQIDGTSTLYGAATIGPLTVFGQFNFGA